MNKLNHLAIIVDGNGRWAKSIGKIRSYGHLKGYENLKKIINYVNDNLDIKYISLFVFSTENFNRSSEEINYLMNLFVNKFQKEKEFYREKNIKVLFSGRKYPLREDVIKTIRELEEKTKNNTGGIFHVCLNYGSQYEIVDAVKKIVKSEIDVETLTPEIFNHYLYQDLPPIDLLIRTSGEMRLSNFLLYQASSAEVYFTDTFFPDFNEEQYEKAIDEYLKRNRRFGGDYK